MKSFTLEKTVPLSLMMYNSEEQLLETQMIDFSFTLITEASSSDEQDLNQARKDQNISFSKILAFLSFIDQSLVYSIDDSDYVYAILGSLNNNFITIPQLNEMSLVAALHSKLNAITPENTHVDRVKMLDKYANLSYEYVLLDDDTYTELPDASEWNTEYSYWKECWWERKDIGTMDKNAENIDEYTDWLATKDEHSVDALNMQVFNEIEEKFENIFCDPKEGEIIPVDFQNKNTLKLVD